MIEAPTLKRVWTIAVVLSAAAVLAVLGFQWMRHQRAASATVTAAHACIKNLLDIDYAKHSWAADFEKDSNAVPTWNELAPYLHWNHEVGFKPPRCPCGGTYAIGRVADFPTCSFPKHSLGLAEFIVHVGDAALDDPYGGDSEQYYEYGESKLRPAGSIVDAKVVVLDETGHRKSAATNSRGIAIVDTWPNKPLTIIVSKRGFLSSSNPIPSDAFRTPIRVRLQRES